jgi:uncharacterized protein (TIGR02757 family)
MRKKAADQKWLKEFLDEKFYRYSRPEFILHDPVQIPHLFTKKEDIEISGFLAATIAWGNRRSIISNATKLMQLMDNAPYEFITSYSKKDLAGFNAFVHRTFNGNDCVFFLRSLRNIYKNHGGLEKSFATTEEGEFKLKERIIAFRKLFLEAEHETRVEKHVSDPGKNSSAKRLCMYLRWMVRKDKCGIDFGIWKSIDPSELCLPLDVHTGNVSRSLGILKRNANDWKSVEEVTRVLRKLDANDPIKYDLALFGLGVSKEI